MLNFAVNRKKSKEFIRFYKENEDKITVYYGNWEKDEFENTKNIKQRLNEIEEEQVRNGIDYFEKNKPILLETSRKEMGHIFFVYSCFSGLAGTLSIPISSLFNVENTFGKVSLIFTSIFLILPINNLIKGIDYYKHNLFLKNKDKINTYLSYKYRDEFETEIYDNSKANKRNKKELCMNDIHNLNIFNIMFTTMMANGYDRKLRLIRNRYNAVNGQREKSPVKQKKFNINV